MRLFLSLSLLFLMSGPSHGADLTETEAVRRGLAQSSIADLLDARRGVAAGIEAAAGRWDNPEIEYNQESLDLTRGSSEERSLLVRQRLNLAGVHALERDAASRKRAAEDARTTLAKQDWIAEIRSRFYEALAANARVEVITTWHSRLEELVAAVTSRVSAGDASRYDLRRLERELALLHGELLTASARAESAHDGLFSLIGGEASPLNGEILPPPVDDIDLAEVLVPHPLLQALSAEADSAALGAEAAARERWPEVTLGIGRLELNQPGTNADGHILSLGVEIPLFNRGRGEFRAEQSRARQLRAERELAEARLAADLRATLRSLASRREAALALGNPASGGEESLAEIAESAYTTGEIDVLALIDAHRTELAARQEAISRALAAREAYIELQLLRGKQE